VPESMAVGTRGAEGAAAPPGDSCFTTLKFNMTWFNDSNDYFISICCRI